MESHIRHPTECLAQYTMGTAACIERSGWQLSLCLELPTCSGPEDASGLWKTSLDALYSVGE